MQMRRIIMNSSSFKRLIYSDLLLLIFYSNYELGLSMSYWSIFIQLKNVSCSDCACMTNGILTVAVVGGI